MSYQSPTLFGVAYTSRLFREVEPTDTLKAFRDKTGSAPNLLNPEHARALLQWLNKWGCRITKGSFDSILPKLADFFQKWARQFPRAELQNLQAHHLDALAGAYSDLLAIDEFGPTSAAKALFALCPHAAMPWDAAIQAAFGLSGREREKYRSMLVLSRREAETLIADAARCAVGDIRSLLNMTGTHALTLPKLLDEYHWVTITRRHQIPNCEELKQWAGWVCYEAIP